MNIVEEQKCVNMALESAYAKGKKDATEKSYNWLDENAGKYYVYGGIDIIRLCEDYRKAMEE